MSGQTFLEGERVVLRPIERDDAEFIQRSRNDPEIRVPVGVSRPQNRHQVEAHVEERVENGGGVNLLVWVDEEPIGEVGFKHLRRNRPELVYWLIPEYHGEGYGSEAVSLFVDYFFETFDRRGLVARTFDSNDGSIGLLESLGFTQEGRLREHRFVRGEYVDEVFYGLLREEWIER